MSSRKKFLGHTVILHFLYLVFEKYKEKMSWIKEEKLVFKLMKHINV